jgi:hypothetical protein
MSMVIMGRRIQQSEPIGSRSDDRPVPIEYRPNDEPPAYTVGVSPSFELQMERGDGHFTVIDGPTGIFGQGETVSAAIRDFFMAVSEHLDVLERQSALSEELAWQLEYLRARLRR